MDGFYARGVDGRLKSTLREGMPFVTVKHLSQAGAFGNKFLKLLSELASKRVSFVTTAGAVTHKLKGDGVDMLT